MYCQPATALRVSARVSDLLDQARFEARKLKGYVPEVRESEELVATINKANEDWTAFALKLDEAIENLVAPAFSSPTYFGSASVTEQIL